MSSNIKNLGKIQNAIIDHVSLGIEDHGILTMHTDWGYEMDAVKVAGGYV